MNKTRIHIVEDEAIIAMEIESQLQNLGYEVTSIVDTGQKAIEKAEEDKPDLILMDIRIKGETDGIEAAEIIRNNFGIPVIFSTAYLDQERIDRAKITIPFGFILKPIQERDLKVTIEMAIYVSEIDKKRQLAELNHLESEEKYKCIFETVPSSIIMTDKNGVITDVNPHHIINIGKGKVTKADFLNRNILSRTSVVSADLSDLYKKVLEGQTIEKEAVYFPTLTGGTDGYFNVKGVPIMSGKKVINAVFVHEDVTSQIMKLKKIE